MRRYSLKRQKRNAEAEPVRQKMVAENQCDICKGDSALVHEIGRGQNRSLSQDKPYAVLVLCDPCHAKVHQGMSLAEQQAYILHSRPLSFDLERYWKLIDRRHPSYSDVTHFLRRLRWQEDERGF